MLTVTERRVNEEVIQTLYAKKEVQLENDGEAVNSHVVLRSLMNDKHTALARYDGQNKYVSLVRNGKININGISPRDANQTSFLDSLLNKNILLSVGVGSAGTGKTTMALAYAAEKYLMEDKVIHLTKPTTFIGDGNAFGPVPGDIQEKYDPYLQSYYIVLKKIFGEKDEFYFKQMKLKNHLQFTPIALARGCTYENATFIIDEAQNLSWHELNSIISRMGEGTKCIVLGDLKQIDIDVPLESTGLYQLLHSEAFRTSGITSGVEMLAQYRSPITQLIADVHEELRTNRERRTN